MCNYGNADITRDNTWIIKINDGNGCTKGTVLPPEGGSVACEPFVHSRANYCLLSGQCRSNLRLVTMKTQLSPRQASGFSWGNALIPPLRPLTPLLTPPLTPSLLFSLVPHSSFLIPRSSFLLPRSKSFTFHFSEVPVSDDFHG